MPNGNIGDDLNEYIWPNYLKLGGNNQNHLVIGIGSLLNVNIPQAQKYTVISAGIGYGELPSVDKNWTFIAVRGEYSKSAFNLNDDVILLDGAYLLRDCYPKPNSAVKNKIGYIPHVESLDYGDWKRVCDLANIQFIDPRLDLDDFLQTLCSCEKVMTEAMHGAIIADCYGIPWKPVKAYHHINTHKWNDWLSAFDTEASFSHINSVWYDIKIPDKDLLKNTIKKIIFKVNANLNVTPPIYPKSNDSDYIEVAGQLKELIKEEFFLNDQSQIDEKVQALKSRIQEQFN